MLKGIHKGKLVKSELGEKINLEKITIYVKNFQEIFGERIHFVKGLSGFREPIQPETQSKQSNIQSNLKNLFMKNPNLWISYQRVCTCCNIHQVDLMPYIYYEWLAKSVLDKVLK